MPIMNNLSFLNDANANSSRITNVADPMAAQDVVTKSFLESQLTYDAYVGTGQEFTELNVAITAGRKNIGIKSNTTETTSSSVVGSGSPIRVDWLGDYTVDLGDQQINTGGNNLYLRGLASRFLGGASNSITTAKTTGNVFVVISNTLYLEGLFVFAFSNAAGTKIMGNNSNVHVKDCFFHFPNQADCGFESIGSMTFENCRFRGSGTSTSGIIKDPDFSGSPTGALNINNCFLEGTGWSTTLPVINCTNRATNKSRIRNLVVNNVGTQPVILDAPALMENISSEDGQNININVKNDNTILNNLDLSAGTLDLADNSACVVDNVNCATLDMTDAGCDNTKLSNSRITNAVTIAGSRAKADNTTFLGGATVQSGADDNGFVNSQFGADGGGGALTLTIDSGSNRTRAAGCMTDAAISDSGTGTVTSANTVY